LKAAAFSEEELRLLYLDWCSTRVAKRFLELSHDEVWLRSHIATTQEGGEGAPAEAGASELALERIPGYLELVRKTALVLARELELPSFAEWREEYRRDPAGFRPEILGQ
jgi:hypothetical protein